MRLEQRVAVITGAGRGIGRAIAERYAREGARVAVHGTGRSGPPDLSGLAGAGHVAVAGDVADADAVQAFVEQATGALGGLDVLVNNAGVFDRLDPRTASYASAEGNRSFWTRVT